LPPHAFGQIGGVIGDAISSATNGDNDPFNSNNKIGIHVDTGISTRGPAPSVITDPQPDLVLDTVNLDGYVLRSVNHGSYRPTNQRANRIIDPKTGRAHWLWKGKPYCAKPAYDDHQLQQNLAKKAAADKQRQMEMQQEAKAKQQFAQLQQQLNGMPPQQIFGELAQLNDQQLIEAKVRLEATANIAQANKLDASGFRRVVQVANRILEDRQIFAQQQMAQAQQILADQRARQQEEWAARQRDMMKSPLPSTGMPGAPPGDGGPPPADGQLGPPPDAIAPAPNAEEGIFAPNLGLAYVRIPYADGTFGARVIRDPDPNSPAAQLGFEPGDVLFALDGQRFRTHQDVLNHTGQTTVEFINVRTKAAQNGTLTLP
jgi:PDZ domain